MRKIYLALGLTAILLLNAGCGSEGTGGIGGDARSETMQEQALHDDSVSKEYINALINGIEYAENMHMSKHDVYEQFRSPMEKNSPRMQRPGRWPMRQILTGRLMRWPQQRLIEMICI